MKKEDTEQVTPSSKDDEKVDNNTTRDNVTSRGSSTQDKRKFGGHDDENEASSPTNLMGMKMASSSIFPPDPKRERMSDPFDLDNDSPTAFPKHVIVPASAEQLSSIDDRFSSHNVNANNTNSANNNSGIGSNNINPNYMDRDRAHHHHNLQPPHLHHPMATEGSFSPPDHKVMGLGYGSMMNHPGGHGAQLLTPDSVGRDRQPSHSYDSHYPPQYSSRSSGGATGHHPASSSYHDVYRTASYTTEMDYGGGASSGRYGGHGSSHNAPPTSSGDNFARPRRWACDYCNVATFLSYEEACAHEEQCTARPHPYNEPTPYPPPLPTHHHHPSDAQRNRYHHGNQHHHTPGRPTTAVSTTSPYGRPPPTMDPAMPISQGGPTPAGLGALYHAGQEVVTPPTPHRHPQSNTSRWSGTTGSQPSTPHGPPLPVFPHEQSYYSRAQSSSSGGYYDGRSDDTAIYPPHDPSYHHAMTPSSQSYHHPYHQGPPQHSPYHHPHFQTQDSYYSHSSQINSNRLVLAMPTDRDSLSDRQCYVRNEMVEIFAATEKDVGARHSKGAQKLVVGQVGIRCVHCRHLRPRDRAERAVCYPSSISRIYQTVADMQRFHFEQCREIPDHVRQIYKKLKTTRPRGVGSPQTYWISSAKTLGLGDTGDGIRFENDSGPAVTSTSSTNASSTIASVDDKNSADMSIGTN